jgi:hypothetical protein
MYCNSKVLPVESEIPFAKMHTILVIHNTMLLTMARYQLLIKYNIINKSKSTLLQKKNKKKQYRTGTPGLKWLKANCTKKHLQFKYNEHLFILAVCRSDKTTIIMKNE